MSRTTKPYRRYRARAGDANGEDGLGRLRELNARESGRATAPEPPLSPAPRRARSRAGRGGWSASSAAR